MFSLNSRTNYLRGQVVDSKPFQVSDLLLTGELDGELLIEVPVQHVGPATLVRHDEPLAAWSVGGPSPEEGVLPIPIIDKVLEEEGVCVHCKHVSTHLGKRYIIRVKHIDTGISMVIG